jgi:hypothetical protein
MADDLKELIPVLLDRTIDGKLIWEPLAGTTLVTRVGEAGVELSRERPSVYLTIRDEQGRRLDGTSDRELNDPIDKMLLKLYDVARRRALKVDEKIETLRADLERL